MDDVWVVKGLQHLQLIVNHLLVASDIFLQNDFNSNFPTAAICLTDNTVRSSTKCSPKFVQLSRARPHWLLTAQWHVKES